MTIRLPVLAFALFLATGVLAAETQSINANPATSSAGVLMRGTRLSISYVPASTNLKLSATSINYDAAKQETTLDGAASVTFDAREITAGKIVVTRVLVEEKDYVRITATDEARP